MHEYNDLIKESDEAVPGGQVRQQLVCLNHVTDQLDKCYAVLNESLSLITRAKEVEPSPNAPEKPILVPLAEQMSNICTRLDNIKARFMSLNNSIDL